MRGASYSPWKALERRHAKRMKGVRLWRPDFGDTAPDGENGTDVWDCKAYERHAVITLFLRAEAKYRAWADGRRFHLALFSRKNGKAGDFVVLRAKDFEALLDVERRLKELLEGPQ